ncbi:MAG: hypothetical protein HYX62_06595 [Gammaproteobacteria bacterium]|jgi:type IV pilus assembly protein PilY1|nr:hypothetical protein [Gammaproteobacteria bacterium]
MKLQTLKKPAAWSTLLAYMLVFASPFAQAAPGTLSNVPLFLTSPVQPNIMILIDNSGSMDNMVWATGYDNSTTYPDWGAANSYPWTANDGNFYLGWVDRSTCANGWKRAVRAGVTKCLKLPDPLSTVYGASGYTRYTGNYLNYLFNTYATGTDLTVAGTIPNDYRMNVAKSVATNLVNNTPNMRFGIASFDENNPDKTGFIRQACDDSTPAQKTKLTNAISALTSATWTPLAETYYQITRYFRGLTNTSARTSADTSSGAAYTSPIQYRCQKNFTIIVTDGLPTYDNTFPTNDPDDPRSASKSLPDWDNLHPNTTEAMYPTFPQYSDGFKPSYDERYEGYSLYLDDMAKFAQDIDLRKAPATDVKGVSFDDPAFLKQTLNTYTIGFSVANQMLQDAASYGKGQYFTATDADSLTEALAKVVSNIASQVGSASAVAFNTATLGTSSAVYQAKFNSGLWSGELLSYALDSVTGNLATSATWNAATKLDARDLSSNDRKILTYNATTKKGIPFKWDTSASGLSTVQQNDLKTGPSGTADAYGPDRLAFLRGDRSKEGDSTTPSFRVRGSRLGDIVHSNPVYVGQPSLNYPDTLPLPSGAPPYSTYKNSSAKDRGGIVYVGANDGMLHGFSAATGEEVMAYIPHNLFSSSAGKGLHYLTDKAYSHLFYVDQGPTVSDVYIKTTTSGTVEWKTILVGGQEAGGRGLFALDITNPNAFSEDGTVADNTVMWEFTDADDSNLGYTFSKPAIALMNNGKWAAIVGNGYNDTNTLANDGGQAKLFILYLEGGLDGVWTPGTDYLEITTKAGSTTDRNGLGTPAVVDLDGNGTVDRVYAGDLQGNMWAFDLSDTAVDNPSWQVAYSQGTTPKPLFTAKIGTTAQQITTKPSVVRHPTIPNNSSPSNAPNLLVLFGTGQYLVDGDKITTGTQSFYGVWDKGDKALLRSNLVAQTFLTGFSSDARVLSDNTVDYATKYGWYIDLAAGERVVVNPKVRGDYVFFNTMTPNNDECSFGGSSWLMAAKLVNGGRPSDAVFDYNNNNSVGADDKLAATVTTTVVTTAGTTGTITTTTTIGGVTTTTVTSNTTGAAPGTVTTTSTTNIAISGRRMQQDAIAAESAFLGDYQYTANSGDKTGASVDEGRIKPGATRAQGRLSWKEIRR